MAVAPSPSPVFSSSYVAVEQWNPVKYYGETGMTARSLPTGTTGETSTAAAESPLGMYLPFAVLIVVIWALERHKMGQLLGMFKK